MIRGGTSFMKGEEMKNVITFALVLGLFFACYANGQGASVISPPGSSLRPLLAIWMLNM